MTTETVGFSNKQRFSWSSTFAGLVAALAVMLVLSVLGLAIGLSTVGANSNALTTASGPDAGAASRP